MKVRVMKMERGGGRVSARESIRLVCCTVTFFYIDKSIDTDTIRSIINCTSLHLEILGI